MKRVIWTCVIAGALCLAARQVSAHGAEMMLGSVASGSGALALSYEFTDDVVVSPSVSIGGMTLYSSIFPGVEWLQQNDLSVPLYALKVGTPFSIQIVQIDTDASVMIGSKTLNKNGQSALIATTTNVAGDHFHPQWQLLLPDGVVARRSVTFMLTTTAKGYATSGPYTLSLTNAASTPTATPVDTATPTPTMLPTDTVPPTDTPVIAAATPTVTQTAVATATDTAEPTSTIPPSPTATESPTASPTATETPIPLRGDANCDGGASAADLPAAVLLLGAPGPLPCGADANGNGQVDESDVLSIIDSIFPQ